MAPFEPAKDLKVFVAYDGVTNGMKACSMLERVGRNSGLEGRLICDWWNLKSLTDGAMRKLAEDDARDAGIVVIAADGMTELPLEIADWINEWLEVGATLATGERHARALVQLLGADSTSNGNSHNLFSGLKEVAEAAGIEFFANGAEGEKEPSSDELKTDRQFVPTHGGVRQADCRA